MHFEATNSLHENLGLLHLHLSFLDSLFKIGELGEIQQAFFGFTFAAKFRIKADFEISSHPESGLINNTD